MSDSRKGYGNARLVQGGQQGELDVTKTHLTKGVCLCVACENAQTDAIMQATHTHGATIMIVYVCAFPVEAFPFKRPVSAGVFITLPHTL
eukprot:5193647-Prymnesium_polylepis.1